MRTLHDADRVQLAKGAKQTPHHGLIGFGGQIRHVHRDGGRVRAATTTATHGQAKERREGKSERQHKAERGGGRLLLRRNVRHELRHRGRHCKKRTLDLMR